MSLSGKVISITGAASGIGLATAKLLATKGARLSLADAQEKPLQALADELEKSGYEIFSKVLDVRKRADVEQWVQNTVQKFGKLDGSVTIAGVAGKGVLIDRIQEIQDEDWDWVFDVNIKGTLNCLRAQIPNFNDGGSIVTIASVAGLTGMQKSAAYVASKHAVVGLSRVATVELGDRNIRVNCICP
jgi:NAD(P)-dependent dehydrogenase (short-subunit alcohol dehydrogenase family)